jgi:hypothetical protein
MPQTEELAALKADIDAGLVDVAAGRVKDFDDFDAFPHRRARAEALSPRAAKETADAGNSSARRHRH